jgi:vancomycin resistance protein VanW
MLKRPLSKHYPILKQPIVFIKKLFKSFSYLNPKYNLEQTDLEVSSFENNSNNPKYRQFKIKKHKSVLLRKLGEGNLDLQQKKVKNLELAIQKFNCRIIKPGQIFSFWKILGNPSYSRGFVDGMILDDGKVTVGAGGGLCQMANLLYWIFLHSPFRVLEHHHHQLDIFPDSGRVLPFGSGAGVLYNYGDLQFKNNTKNTFYLKTWRDQEFLYGELCCLGHDFPLSYKIYEKNHKIYQKNENGIVRWYRKNEILRITRQKQGGRVILQELITKNNSPILYDMSVEKAKEINQFYKEKEINFLQSFNPNW